MSNIAEGFEIGGRVELHQILVIAKVSCAEIRLLLYVALDVGFINSEDFRRVNGLVVEMSNIIRGMRTAVYGEGETLK
ncbi:MAG TPA: four helix bundle protein [Candidatus Brocadiaceae bacterium]